MNWIDYWNGTPTIYVSARHQEAHDFDVAFSMIRLIRQPGLRVLDFGCGDATRAQFIASRCKELLLWDAAEVVRNRLSARYGKSSNIAVLQPEAFAALEANSIDLITIISVIQYLDEAALSHLLATCNKLLANNGTIIIADVIPPDVGVIHDAWELMHFAHGEGFLHAAVLGMVRTAFSSYVSLRSRLRLKKYTIREFETILLRHGFLARRLDRNLGHNRRRLAFEVMRAPPAETFFPHEPHVRELSTARLRT